MNDVYGTNNLPTSVIADSADEKIFKFVCQLEEFKDLYLLPYFEKIVQVQKSGRQLIVVHLRGSHFDYAKRYPTDFAVFKPDACDERDCTINAYRQQHTVHRLYSFSIHRGYQRSRGSPILCGRSWRIAWRD